MAATVAGVLSFIGVTCVICLLWPVLTQWFSPTRRRLLGLVVPPHQAAKWERQRRLAALVLRWFQVGFQKVVQGIGLRRYLGPSMAAQPPSHQLLLAGFLGVVAVVGFTLTYRKLSGFMPGILALLCSLGAAWVGVWLAARYWIGWHATRRAEEINNGLINVLDLWALCLGAGMSFQAALVKVSEDAELTTSALHKEIKLTTEETLAGCPRDEALRHLVHRCGNSSEMRALASHIVQAERLGTSLAQTLKTYADSLRFKRRQDTTELIQKMPVKLAFPLVFFIFPALFVVILGPSGIRLLEILSVSAR